MDPLIVRVGTIEITAERIERNGQFIGHIVPYYKPVRVYRATFAPAKRPIFYCITPNGRRTEFTLPSRKQAIEWLEDA